MSLLVVVMVPVMLAAVWVAVAAPRYLAASRAVGTTAENLAVVASIQREAADPGTGQPTGSGELRHFPPDCRPDPATACDELWDIFAADLGALGIQADAVGYYTNAARDHATASNLPTECGGAPTPSEALGTDGSSVVVALITTWSADDWASSQTSFQARDFGGIAVADPYGTSSLRPGYTVGSQTTPDVFDIYNCQAIYQIKSTGPIGDSARQFWAGAERSPFGTTP